MPIKIIILCCITSIFLLDKTYGQINYTANNVVPPFNGTFLQGTNFGVYAGFSDESLGILAGGNDSIPGAGVQTIRPLLPENFLEIYGYDLRIPTFKFYDSLGLKDHTAIVGYPIENHRDKNQYCPGAQSELFANLYEPIWDGGLNGTPVNENNFYAVYLWKTATRYKDYIKFWEIWNEPGFDFTKVKAYLPPGAPGNWWENNPDPCDYKLRAPVFHFIRMLRISYEIIKSVDPNDYILLSGVGYPSFLDVILRNSDNPLDGSISTNFPLKGGAYFDAMGNHSYPHFDGSLRKWSDSLQTFIYFRHSDAAALGIPELKSQMQKILDKYGYNGTTFPEKIWNITECNLPRKRFGDYIGDEISQKNFILKAVAQCHKNAIRQLHIYKIAEDYTEKSATREFDLMGLYEKPNAKNKLIQKRTPMAIAYRTSDILLKNYEYDNLRTNNLKLKLPVSCDGIVLKNKNGNIATMLWKKTITDLSEFSDTLDFVLPASLRPNGFNIFDWNYSEGNFILPKNDSIIRLTSSPIITISSRININASNKLCVGNSLRFNVILNSGEQSLWTIRKNNQSINLGNSNPLVWTPSENGDWSLRLQIKNSQNVIVYEEEKILPIKSYTQKNLDFTVEENLPFRPIVKHPKQDGNYEWRINSDLISSDIYPILYPKKLDSVYSITLKLKDDAVCGNNFLEKTIVIKNKIFKIVNSVYTADTKVIPDPGPFRMGTIPIQTGVFNDDYLASMAAGDLSKNKNGSGIKSFKVLLPQSFLEFWGYDIRESTFRHYANVGMNENTMVLDFANEKSLDTYEYCPGIKSQIFKGIYETIWDNGENGTPYNDKNIYARYVYESVIRYKDQVKFYQVLNSPDYEQKGEHSWLPPGFSGNWWESSPEPCEISLGAPVSHYVRMLRVAYEIIHKEDPDGYVLTASFGFPSFLDAVLRQTDEPSEGKIAPLFPANGGAYFDGISFNSYPHLDGSTSGYEVDSMKFIYRRHSDAAAEGILKLKNRFQSVLEKYGYNGVSKPSKLLVIGELNTPRKSFNNQYGGEDSQRDYLMKAYVTSQANNISHLYIQSLSEKGIISNANDGGLLQGLFTNLDGKNLGQEEITRGGIGVATLSNILYGSKFDSIKTSQLLMPNNSKGYAFKQSNGNYIYVLWAKTTEDLLENANSNYSFPSGMITSGKLWRYNWDYHNSNQNNQINSSQISLTQTPIILSENSSILRNPIAYFTLQDSVGCIGQIFSLNNLSSNATEYLWNFPGGTPSTSKEINPKVFYNQPGKYRVLLTAKNIAGLHTYALEYTIRIPGKPKADFTFSTNGSKVSFTNTAKDFTELIWDFGNGNRFGGLNPTFEFLSNGNYNVKLIAKNECGIDSTEKIVNISAKPKARFETIYSSTCNNFKIRLIDISFSNPDSLRWIIESKGTFTESAPLIDFERAGKYKIILIAINAFGRDTLTRTIQLFNGTSSTIRPQVCQGGSVTILGQTFSSTNPYAEIVIPSGSWRGCDSIIYIEMLVIPPTPKIVEKVLSPGQTFVYNGQTINKVGTYLFTLKTNQGCDSLVQLIVKLGAVGTEEINQESKWEVFPNPSYDMIFLQLDKTEIKENENLTLVDFQGRTIQSWNTSQFGEILSSGISIQHLSPGLYFLKRFNTNGISLRKLVKIN
jgi:PKD repeat protein